MWFAYEGMLYVVIHTVLTRLKSIFKWLTEYRAYCNNGLISVYTYVHSSLEVEFMQKLHSCMCLIGCASQTIVMNTQQSWAFFYFGMLCMYDVAKFNTSFIRGFRDCPLL